MWNHVERSVAQGNAGDRIFQSALFFCGGGFKVFTTNHVLNYVVELGCRR